MVFVWNDSSARVCKNSGTTSYKKKSMFEVTSMLLYEVVSLVRSGLCSKWSLYEVTVNPKYHHEVEIDIHILKGPRMSVCSDHSSIWFQQLWKTLQVSNDKTIIIKPNHIIIKYIKLLWLSLWNVYIVSAELWP